LLYAILLQEPGSLSKPLRLILNQWNFVIEKKQKRDVHVVTTSSTNSKSFKNAVENLTQADDGEVGNLRNEEEEYIPTATGLVLFYN